MLVILPPHTLTTWRSVESSDTAADPAAPMRNAGFTAAESTLLLHVSSVGIVEMFRKWINLRYDGSKPAQWLLYVD